MVRLGQVDGCVAGAVHTTGDVLRAALWLVGPADGVRTVSSAFYMVVPAFRGDDEEVLTFTDCAVVPYPERQPARRHRDRRRRRSAAHRRRRAGDRIPFVQHEGKRVGSVGRARSGSRRSGSGTGAPARRGRRIARRCSARHGRRRPQGAGQSGRRPSERVGISIVGRRQHRVQARAAARRRERRRTDHSGVTSTVQRSLARRRGRGHS